ncbi:MAG: hypothetical protein M1834_001433 [Cirrosporium novae-zelandiae]|nr:MAG: hypothetical protein M1834_001433 [Cirrosporium novae-zelandiae]
MLSNPSSSQLQRQRQHRRQRSTPAAFEVPKIPLLPASPLQRNGSHRRGLSLDQRSPRKTHFTPGEQQGNGKVSITNIGLQQQDQHIVRETQQHRPNRPGQPQGQPVFQQNTVEAQGNAFLPDPFIDQQFHSGSGSLNDTLYTNSPIAPNSDSGNQLSFEAQLQMYMPHSASGYLNDGLGLEFDNVINNGKMQRSQSAMALSGTAGFELAHKRRGSVQSERGWQNDRPLTPPSRNSTSYFPVTPDQTSMKRASNGACYSPVRQLSPTRQKSKLSKSFQPGEHQQSLSLDNIFEGTVCHSPIRELPSPPNTAALQSSSTFDSRSSEGTQLSSFSSMAPELRIEDFGYESSQHSTTSHTLSPNPSSYNPSPNIAPLPTFANLRIRTSISEPRNVLVPSSAASVASTSSSPVKAPMSPKSTMIADLNLEIGVDASIEETGITLEDISAFIEGPDPNDGKYVCRYSSCNKRFGRKENIKSHVQTHLGDRQYRCNHCQKCFVRGHDLKRHAKIHSGVKPYPCLCGMSFARHDALTRHRQRGMCVGAFDGVVKKQIKRGRPKKKKELEERLDKAQKTRQRAIEKAYPSSVSGSSESSYAFSPEPLSDNISIRGSSPFDNFQPLPHDSFGLPPDAFSFTPPASPGYSTGNPSSPSRATASQCQSQTHTPAPSVVSSPRRRPVKTIPEEPSKPNVPVQDKNPSQGVEQYSSPPELDLSSSPPAECKFFDFECGSGMESGQSTQNNGFDELPSQHKLDNMLEPDDLLGQFDTNAYFGEPLNFEDPFNIGDTLAPADMNAIDAILNAI